jgi:hypothetical protein
MQNVRSPRTGTEVNAAGIAPGLVAIIEKDMDEELVKEMVIEFLKEGGEQYATR